MHSTTRDEPCRHWQNTTRDHTFGFPGSTLKRDSCPAVMGSRSTTSGESSGRTMQVSVRHVRFPGISIGCCTSDPGLKLAQGRRVRRCSETVCFWGSYRPALQDGRDSEVLTAAATRQLYCRTSFEYDPGWKLGRSDPGICR